MRKLFSGLVERRRGNEKVSDMDGKEGLVFSCHLGIDVIGWVAWGRRSEARLCLTVTDCSIG
jgi:hypothetical protein